MQGQGLVKEACADRGMQSCLLRRVHRQVTIFGHQDNCLALTAAIERLYRNNEEPRKEGAFHAVHPFPMEFRRQDAGRTFGPQAMQSLPWFYILFYLLLLFYLLFYFQSLPWVLPAL